MTYDRKTGNVEIIDPAEKKVKKTIITNLDKEDEDRKNFMKSIGLNSKGEPFDDAEINEKDIPELSENIYKARKYNQYDENVSYDPAT